MDLNDIKNLAGEHKEQVEDGLGKAADFATEKIGHEDEINKAEDAAKNYLDKL